MFHSVCSYFHWKKNMLGLPFNGSASCVWNTCVHENVICYKKISTQHLTGRCAGAREQVHTHTTNTLTVYTHTNTHTQTTHDILTPRTNDIYIYRSININMIIYLNYSKINCQNVKCAKYFPYTFILPELAHQWCATLNLPLYLSFQVYWR